jgi:hypothetical protein
VIITQFYIEKKGNVWMLRQGGGSEAHPVRRPALEDIRSAKPIRIEANMVGPAIRDERMAGEVTV